MFKKGDKVYSILRGWGEVIRDGALTVTVKYPSIRELIYFHDGKYNETDLIPELYHTEPVITVPKRRVEHTGWIQIANHESLNGNRQVSGAICETKGILDQYFSDKDNYTKQQITYYTEE